MKKILSIAAALLFTLTASAQVYVNIGAGRLSNINGIGDKDIQKSSSALVVGASYNFTLIDDFGLEAGLNYLYDFYNYKLDTSDDAVLKSRYHGLNAPIELNYKFDLGNNVKLVVLAGPVLNFGISDKKKTFIGDKAMGTVDYYAQDIHKRFKVSGELALAAEFADCIRMKFGYQLGFTNINKASSPVYKQNMYCFTLGYSF